MSFVSQKSFSQKDIIIYRIITREREREYNNILISFFKTSFILLQNKLYYIYVRIMESYSCYLFSRTRQNFSNLHNFTCPRLVPVQDRRYHKREGKGRESTNEIFFVAQTVALESQDLSEQQTEDILHSCIITVHNPK